MATLADADITLLTALERSEFYRTRYAELLLAIDSHGWECREDLHPGQVCPLDKHFDQSPSQDGVQNARS